MATGHEVIVKIIADAKKAVSEFDKTADAAKRMAKRTEDETQKAKISLDKLGKQGLIMGGAMVAAGTTMAIGLGSFVHSAEESEKAQLRLQNTIKGNKNLAPDSIRAFNDQAKAIENVTVASDEAVNGIQAMLGQFGMTKNQVLTLTPLVVDISRKMGIDFNTAAKAVGKAAEGSTAGLKRMGVMVDETKAKIDPFAATVDALRRSAGGFAQQEGQTFAGQMAILKNHADDLKESVGRGVLGALNSVLPAVNGAASGFLKLDESTGNLIGRSAALTSGLLILVGGAMTTVATVYKLKKAYDEAAASSEALAIAQSGALVAGAAIAGVALGQAGGHALDEAIFHFGEKASKGYKKAFSATTSKEAMRGFIEAAEGEAGKGASSIGSIFHVAGLMAVGTLAGPAGTFAGLMKGLNDTAHNLTASGFNKAFSKIATADPEAAKSILRYIGTHDEMRRALEKSGVSLADYRKRMRDTADANHDGTVSADEFVQNQQRISQTAQTVIQAVSSQGAVTRAWTTAVLDVNKAQSDLTKAQADYNAALRSGDPAKVAEAQTVLQGALLQLAAAQDQAREAAFNHAQMLLTLKGTAGDTQAFNAAISQLKAMRDILTDPAEKKAIQDKIDALVAFRVTAGQPVNLNDGDMIGSLYRLKAAGAITEAQLRALQGGPGGWTLTVNTKPAADALTAFAAQYHVPIAAIAPNVRWELQNVRASGGPVAGGTPYLVGERGPEMFVPNGNGTIVPNNQLGTASTTASGPTYLTINVDSTILSTPAEQGAALVQALKAYERRNGALPLKVAS